MTITVRFENVGREKRTWSARLPDLTWERMVREARKALRSIDVWFTIDDDATHGSIIAGFHQVGTWRVVEQDEHQLTIFEARAEA